MRRSFGSAIFGCLSSNTCGFCTRRVGWGEGTLRVSAPLERARFSSNKGDDNDGDDKSPTGAVPTNNEKFILGLWEERVYPFFVRGPFQELHGKYEAFDDAAARRVGEVASAALKRAGGSINDARGIRHLLLCSILLGTYHGLSTIQVSHDRSIEFLRVHLAEWATKITMHTPIQDWLTYGRMSFAWDTFASLLPCDRGYVKLQNLFNYFNKNPVPTVGLPRLQLIHDKFGTHTMGAQLSYKLGGAEGGEGEGLQEGTKPLHPRAEEESRTSRAPVREAELVISNCQYRPLIDTFEAESNVRADLLALCCCQAWEETLFSESNLFPGDELPMHLAYERKRTTEGCCKMVVKIDHDSSSTQNT